MVALDSQTLPLCGAKHLDSQGRPVIEGVNALHMVLTYLTLLYHRMDCPPQV